MKKTLLTLLSGISLISMGTAVTFGKTAFAQDKILSSVGGWSVSEGTVQGGGCQVEAPYESDAVLALISEAGRIHALQVHVTDANFANVSAAEIAIFPSFKQDLPAKELDSETIQIDISSAPSLLSVMQGAVPLMYVAAGKQRYGFSLNGVENAIRKARSCNDTDWQRVRQAFDLSADDFSDDKVVSSDGATNSEGLVTLRIDPFPLQAATNNQGEARSTSAASAPRIYEPLVKVQPSGEVNANANQMAAVDAKQAISEVEAVVNADAGAVGVETAANLAPTAELSKPPAFDYPAGDVINPGQSQQQKAGSKPDAAALTPLARMNDISGAVYVEDSPKLLAQTKQQAKSAPVIIPAVPESTLPTKFDLMRNANAVEPLDHPIREVSNQDLEAQIRGQDTQVDIKAAPAAEVAAEPVIDAEEVGNMGSDVSVAVVTEESGKAESSDKWQAEAGVSLREVVAAWSLAEGVELVWDNDAQFQVPTSIHMNDTYEEAVSYLLNLYMQQSNQLHPVGELYVDPENGHRVLIIRAVQS